jgi:hypothetical protein
MRTPLLDKGKNSKVCLLRITLLLAPVHFTVAHRYETLIEGPECLVGNFNRLASCETELNQSLQGR